MGRRIRETQHQITDQTLQPREHIMDKLTNIKSYFLKAAIGLAIFTPVFFAVAAIGTKSGLWGWMFGFVKMTMGYGPKIMMLTFVVSLIAVILSLIAKPRKDWMVALLCLAVPVIGMGFGKSVKAKAGKLPPIHDITTDTQNPPTFTQAIVDSRAKCSNSLDYIGTTYGKDKTLVSAAQVKAYPDIRTLVFTDNTATMYKRALATVDAMGWKLASRSEDMGTIEASYSSFWFGFTDDIAIRIRPSEGGGSLLDIRSVSCVGRSDLGKNAARIRKFRDALGG